MNTSHARPDEGAEQDRAIAFTMAVLKAYDALHKVKRRIKGQRRQSKALLRYVEDLEAHLNTICVEASVRKAALEHMTRIAAETQRDYDELLLDTEAAYEAGWKAALEIEMEVTADRAWRAPDADRVLELISEARQLLAANDATES